MRSGTTRNGKGVSEGVEIMIVEDSQVQAVLEEKVEERTPALRAEIAERRQVEGALGESEELYRYMVQTASDAIICFDSCANVIFWNSAAEALFGYSAEEMVGSPLAIVVAERGRGSFVDSLKRLTSSEQESATGRSSEMACVRKDGSEFPAEISCGAWVTSEGMFFTGILRDITRRQLAEEALKRYQVLCEHATEIILFISQDGHILEANNAAICAYGYTREELLSMTLCDLSAGEITPSVATQVAQVDSAAIQFEATHRRKDGSTFPVEVSFQATTIGQEHVLLSIIRDVTKRRRAEEDLKQAQKMLVHSEKMASIGQLAAGVAHEINNPVGFISSNLNTMREYVRSLKKFIEESDETLRMLRTRLDGQIEPVLVGLDQLREKLDLDYVLNDIDNLINESLEGSQRVRRIVQDLKTFSRADDGDMQLVDVNCVLDSALNIVWNQLKYTCTISKDYGRVPEIRCNPNQIGQVFVNLLANAGQAIAGQKQGEIKIRTYADDGAIIVEVGDNGEGIPAQNLAKIFDPFFTTKPVGQGTGLGLSISYSIIQKHGGQIHVDSEVGAGTTFTIKLPTSTTG